jgi:hypothetical protein
MGSGVLVQHHMTWRLPDDQAGADHDCAVTLVTTLQCLPLHFKCARDKRGIARGFGLND